MEEEMEIDQENEPELIYGNTKHPRLMVNNCLYNFDRASDKRDKKYRQCDKVSKYLIISYANVKLIIIFEKVTIALRE
jgi:hypothetical protein